MKRNYDQEFQVFSTNVGLAARSFYCLMAMGNFPYQTNYWPDRFRRDHGYMYTLSLVIVLGRIFDRTKSSHSLKSLLKAAKDGEVFSRHSLLRRKQSLDHLRDWSAYCEAAHEFSEKDCKEIIKFTIEIRKKWKIIKPIRNKILAHQEKLKEQKVLNLLKKGKYDYFEEIIQNLLTLENIFQQAAENGRKPDYTFIETGIKSRCEEMVRQLFGSLQEGVFGS